MKKSTIMTSLEQIINTYNSSGFRVRHILGDGQFEETAGIILNITRCDEHVPEVERDIRIIKK